MLVQEGGGGGHVGAALRQEEAQGAAGQGGGVAADLGQGGGEFGQSGGMKPPVSLWKPVAEAGGAEQKPGLGLIAAHRTAAQKAEVAWPGGRPAGQGLVGFDGPRGQFGHEAGADAKDEVVKHGRHLDARLCDAIAEKHVLILPQQIDGRAGGIADLECGEIAQRLAQGGGMAQDAAEGAEGAEVLALRQKKPEILAAAEPRGAVEDRHEGREGDEAVRAQLLRRHAGFLQCPRKVDAMVSQKARQGGKRSRALQRKSGRR